MQSSAVYRTAPSLVHYNTEYCNKFCYSGMSVISSWHAQCLRVVCPIMGHVFSDA